MWLLILSLIHPAWPSPLIYSPASNFTSAAQLGLCSPDTQLVLIAVCCLKHWICCLNINADLNLLASSSVTCLSVNQSAWIYHSVIGQLGLTESVKEGALPYNQFYVCPFLQRGGGGWYEKVMCSSSTRTGGLFLRFCFTQPHNASLKTIFIHMKLLSRPTGGAITLTIKPCWPIRSLERS